jgi:ABC-2 type transport system permease protein
LTRVGTPPRFLRGFTSDVEAVWAYRELLSQLVRKELKVKYKESILGFFWTMARPMLQIVIYYVAFTVFLGSRQPAFAIFVFTGLLAWQFFTDVVGGCTGTVVGNGALIKKTYFPREVFPLSVVGAALVNFFFQFIVLLGALVVAGVSGFRVAPSWDLLLVPLALLVAVVWATAIGMALAALTVQLRDLQYLIDVVLLAGFWLTPVVYPITYPVTNLGQRGHHLILWIYLANPMVSVVAAFQRAFYTMGQQYTFTGSLTPRLLVLLVVGLGALWLGQRVFARLRGSFAQEL